MENLLLLSSAVSGAYFCTSFWLGMELSYGIFRARRTQIPSAMRFAGWAMLMSAVAMVLWFVQMLGGASFYLRMCEYFVHGLVSINLFLTAYGLLTERMPSCGMVLPMLLVLMLCCGICLLFPDVVIWSALVWYGLLGIAMFFLAAYMYHRDNQLHWFYSNVEDRTISWYVVFICFAFLEMPLYYMLIVRGVFGSWGVIVCHLTMIMLYIYLTIRLLHQQDTPALVTFYREPSPKTEYYQLAAEKNNFQQQLTQLMEEKRLYEHPDLSMEDLVKALNTNTNYLYSFMRNTMQTNFYSYINGYRVEKAKQMLEQTNSKMEAIAFDCGFNSYNSFCRVFKHLAGCSPSTYRQRLQSAK